MTQLITQSSTGLSGSTASVLKIPGRVQSSRVWTANVFNTVIIATITSIVIPFLFYFLWRPAILNTMTVINRDEIVTISKSSPFTHDMSADKKAQPSAYYPSFAVLQNIDWSSQAQLTLDSSPKCFVGWMKDNLPACADVADDARGAWCNCTANWDETIEDFTWHDSRYKMLSWTTTADMVNMEPTVPILAQAFFNCTSIQIFLSTLGKHLGIVRSRRPTYIRIDGRRQILSQVAHLKLLYLQVTDILIYRQHHESLR